MHDAFGGVVPEIASRHHLELVNAVVDDALARAGATLDDVSLVAVTQGPGLVGALLVGVATAKGIAAARAAAARARRPPAGPRRGELPRAGADGAAVPVPDRLGRAHAARAGPRPPRLRGAGADARRRGRRGVRQGRAAARASATRAARRCRGWRWRATRRRSPSRPPRGCAGLDFSFAGLKTALLYAVRDLGEEETARRAADLAASYEHAIVEALVARIERALAAEPGARLAIGGGVAANRRLRARAEALGVPVKVPPPELCTDNAAMIASAARWVDPLPFPDFLALDAYATGARRRPLAA